MIRDITIGQYYPANSLIHRLDPAGEDCLYAAVFDFAFCTERFAWLCNSNSFSYSGHQNQ